jgi:hypothetical protein
MGSSILRTKKAKNRAVVLLVLSQNKLAKPIKLRPAGAPLYGFYLTTYSDRN